MKKYLFLIGVIVLSVLVFNPIPINSTVCAYRTSADMPTVNFADTIVGNKSGTTTVTITNTCDCGLALNNLVVSLSGESGEFNIETNTCTGMLANTSSCQVGISFEPSTTGSHSASLTLTTTEATFTNRSALSGTGIVASDNTALLVAAAASRDDSSGCDATASTGAAGGKSFGPAALGFISIMGLVLGIAAVRRGTRKRS